MPQREKRHPFPPELGDEPDARELEEVWDLLADPQPQASPGEVDDAWTEVRKRTGLGTEDHVQPTLKAESTDQGRGSPSPGTPFLRWGSGLAMAAAVAALALGFGVLGESTLEAGPGETLMVTLEDGSMVELNSGSSLSHPRWTPPWSRPNRAVSLEGEAYFDVTPGDAPFVVETFNAQVTVLGTRFNLRARDELGGGTDLALESGRVRIAGRNGTTEVELAPGQRSSVALGTTDPSPPEGTELERILSWRTQGFAALDRPLGGIVAELERRFGVEIQLGDEVDPTDRLTLHYQEARDLRGILGDIATARGLRFRETSQGYELY